MEYDSDSNQGLTGADWMHWGCTSVAELGTSGAAQRFGGV